METRRRGDIDIMPGTKIKKPGYAIIGLISPKTPTNVGSALRACGCFGVASLFVEKPRYSKLGRPATDTSCIRRHMPFYDVDDLHEVIPYDCIPVAIDLIDGARNMKDYCHPRRAFYIFGPEDGTLGKRTLSFCRDVVYIPTNGCVNLAAAVNIVLYDRTAKQS